MSKKILIVGGTGLIGKELSALLLSHGHEISILSRSKQDHPHYKFFKWDIAKEYIEEGALDQDYIVHLAGAGVADKRWSEERKKVIIGSRVESTALLEKKLSQLKGRKPGYIGASAIGIYGNNDDHPLNEDEVTVDRDSFLVDVVHRWENAHKKLKDHVTSHAIVRIGIVLSTEGGVLNSLLIPFNFRMANYFGDGSQIFSWIHIIELCRIFAFIMENNLSGTFNGVAPNPVTGKKLVKTISKIKPGPFLRFGVPEMSLKLLFGEMSQAVLMSTWASADNILNAGFDFEFETIEQAMKDLLQKEN